MYIIDKPFILTFLIGIASDFIYGTGYQKTEQFRTFSAVVGMRPAAYGHRLFFPHTGNHEGVCRTAALTRCLVCPLVIILCQHHADRRRREKNLQPALRRRFRARFLPRFRRIRDVIPGVISGVIIRRILNRKRFRRRCVSGNGSKRKIVFGIVLMDVVMMRFLRQHIL